MAKACTLQEVTDNPVEVTHPLLDELTGLLARLKYSSQPIKDGHSHLVPFCESLEAVFRDGLKQPNSWFGLNKQDYWCWIEPLQDYYFDQKQNPVFSRLVQDIQSLQSVRSLQARGRCFIRAALHHKLISVPIEHLSKSVKLTKYWYVDDSIIASKELREVLMDILFQATELNFDLDFMKVSFLDETWVIPVYLKCRLPPIKMLDIDVVHINKRELIVSIQDGCLAKKAGIEVWDILDGLCGTPINMIRSGKFQNYVAKHSIDHTDITVVKRCLPDGIPFGPVLQCQLTYTQRTDASPLVSWLPEIIQNKSSRLIQSEGECTEYTVIYLGKSQCIASKIGQELIDNSISLVLNKTKRPEVVLLNIGVSMVQMTGAVSHSVHNVMITCIIYIFIGEHLFHTSPFQIYNEIIDLFNPSSLCYIQFLQQPILKCGYQLLSICGQSSKHSSCLALLVHEGYIDGKEGEERKRTFACYVCEVPTPDFAFCICSHIAQGFSQDSSLSTSE